MLQCPLVDQRKCLCEVKIVQTSEQTMLYVTDKHTAVDHTKERDILLHLAFEKKCLLQQAKPSSDMFNCILDVHYPRFANKANQLRAFQLCQKNCPKGAAITYRFLAWLCGNQQYPGKLDQIVRVPVVPQRASSKSLRQ